MDWVKVAIDTDHHPQMLAAGYRGRTLFLALLRVSGRFNLAGNIPAAFCAPSFLASYLGAPESEVVEGLNGCSTAGLIVDGNEPLSIRIDGWDRWNKTFVSTERVRKHREKKRDETHETVSATKKRDETPRIEEKRIEEKRLLKDSSPAGDRCAEAFAVWNARVDGKLKAATKLNAKRRGKIRDTFADVPLDEWPKAIDELLKWPWGRGENPSGWKASLDWFCGFQKETGVRNALRCIEGTLGGASVASLAELRSKPVRAEDQGWSDFPIPEAK